MQPTTVTIVGYERAGAVKIHAVQATRAMSQQGRLTHGLNFTACCGKSVVERRVFMPFLKAIAVDGAKCCEECLEFVVQAATHN